LSKPDVYLIWDDCALLVINAPAGLLKELRIRVKDMKLIPVEIRNADNEVVRTYNQKKLVHGTENLYTVLRESPYTVIQTMQGYKDEIWSWLVTNGYPVHIADRRLPFPKPRLNLMSGFRFSQKELITRALVQDRSGLIGAPTRYGKSVLMQNTARAFPQSNILVTLPGEDLIRQTRDGMVRAMPGREVVMIGGGRGSKHFQAQGNGLTVCSVQSLHKCDPGITDLLLGDEVHALVTENRLAALQKFENVRRLGFGATLSGRFDGRDRLITGYFGSVLAERTYKEAVAEGAICPLVVFFVRIPVPVHERHSSRDRAYDQLLFRNPGMARACKWLCDEVLPPDYQTLLFIKHEKQADLYQKIMGREDVTVAMAKKMNQKQKESMFERMASGEVLRCLATNIYAQGVTFSDMRCMINCEGGGNNTSAIQKPGRLAEIRPGKNWGLVVDWLFDDQGYVDSLPSGSKRPEWWNLVRDSQSRLQAYQDKGYEIVICDNREQLKNEMHRRL
jgi:superfamily II DNA or RNA helicase